MQSQALFTKYIIAGVEASLARVRAAEYVVPEADRQQAWHLLSFALKLDEAWPVTRELLLALAPKMEMAGFWEEWIPYLMKGVQSARTVGDEVATAECELQIGLLYRLLSRFEEAEQWTKTSSNRFAVSNNTQGYGRALNELAWLEHLQHRYDEATQHAKQAIAILNEQDPERAMSYRVQGMIAIEQGDFLEAEAQHRKALQIFTNHSERRRIAWGLHNLAYAIRWQNRFDEAIPLFQQAAAILEEVDDKSHWAIIQLNLGNALLYSNQQDKAIKHLLLSEKIFSQRIDQLQLARIATNLGLAYLSQNAYAKAQQSFQQSINLFADLGEQIWYLNAMDGLAMTYLASEKYNDAIEILVEALNLLPEIADTPNYSYLSQSLNQHLQQAQQGQGII